MSHPFDAFVHPRHQPIFSEAASHFGCHILVRKTGTASVSWIGRDGYTGKRGDMKAKTGKQNVGEYQLAGLVCSPHLWPGAFKDLRQAQECWAESSHLVTIPPDQRGFDDWSPVRCGTPYILQTNPRHRHYGCIAWVEMGLMAPAYVHGDYDLYAIVPAGRAFDPAQAGSKAVQGQAGSLMRPGSGTPQPAHGGFRPGQLVTPQQDRQRLMVPDMLGPFSFRVATYINNRIAQGRTVAGALMVNHAEAVNLGPKGIDESGEVLAFLARAQAGSFAKVLVDAVQRKAFFESA